MLSLSDLSIDAAGRPGTCRLCGKPYLSGVSIVSLGQVDGESAFAHARPCMEESLAAGEGSLGWDQAYRSMVPTKYPPTAWVKDDRLRLMVPYDKEGFDKLKVVSGRRYHADPKPHWSFPVDQAAEVVDVARLWPGFVVSAELQALSTSKRSRNRIEVRGTQALLFLAYGADTEAVKAVPGASWDGETKAWTFPLEQMDAALAAGRVARPDLQVHASFLRQQRLEEQARLSSTATDSDQLIEYPGVGRLRGYQTEGVRFLQARNGCGLNGDEMGLGKCLSPDTLLAVPTGLRAVGDFSESDETGFTPARGPVCLGGEVVRFFRQEPTARRRLITEGGFEVTGSRQHLILRRDVAGTRLTRLDALQVGDWVAIERSTPLVEATVRLPDPPEVPPNAARHPVPTHLTEELSEWMGLFIADGSGSREDGGIHVTAHDPTERRWQVDLTRSVFPTLSTTEHERGWKTHSVLIRRWLAACGIGFVTAPDKEIPWVVLQGGRSNLRGFLRGVFHDASPEGGGVEFNTSSEKLGSQVQLALLRFGVVSVRTSRPGPKPYEDRTYWRITIFGRDAKLFAERVGLPPHTQPKLVKSIPTRSNTNKDVIPHTSDLVQGAMRRLIAAGRLNSSERLYRRLREVRVGRNNLTYESLDLLLERADGIQLPALRELQRDRFFWTPVAQAEYLDAGPLVDVEVSDPRHLYVSGGLVSHNTIQVVAYSREAGLGESLRALYVVPASVRVNWARETQKWAELAPERIMVCGIKPSRRLPLPFRLVKVPAPIPAEVAVVVINYDVLGRWLEHLAAARFDLIALDEAQYIQNPRAARSRQAGYLGLGIRTQYDLASWLPKDWVIHVLQPTFHGDETSVCIRHLGPKPRLPDERRKILAETDAVPGNSYTDPAELAPLVEQARRLGAKIPPIDPTYRGIPRRIPTTGTPILKYVPSLWHLLHFVDPVAWSGQAGGFKPFTARYMGAYLNHRRHWTMGDRATNTEELHQRLLGSYMVRRRKEDVLKDLPAKTVNVVHLEPTSTEMRPYFDLEDEIRSIREEYQRAKTRMEAAHDDEHREVVLLEARDLLASALGKASQLRQTLGACKVPAVVRWLQQLLDAEEPVVLFAWHQVVQRELLEALQKAKVPTGHIFSSDSALARVEAIDAFQGGQTRAIVCSIKAANIGITLHRAAHTVHVERAWNPADNDQAEDRTHRMGQLRPCFSWYLDVPGTFDVELDDLCTAKKRDQQLVLDGRVIPRNGSTLTQRAVLANYVGLSARDLEILDG